MAFFKDLSKKITEGVQEATEKASELVEVQKLNAAINKEKNAIDDAKQAIGDKIFAMYKSGEPLPDILTADLQTITNHLQAITGLEAKIREVKGEPPITAPAPPQSDAPAAPAAPPTEAPNDSIIPDAAPAVEDATAEAQPAAAVKFCPECGAKLTEGTAFCGECGTKVQ